MGEAMNAFTPLAPLVEVSKVDQLDFLAPDPNADPLIGLTVRPDDDCSCGEGVAVIKAAKHPHAGALICITCGKHRGWLPRHAADFITENIKHFGRPSEPVSYRRGPTASTEGNTNVKHFDNTNRGSLFNNQAKKKSDTDSDYSGSINIDGAEFWLNGWIKTSKTKGTKFLSLSVRPKETEKKKADFNDSVEF
jgi:hypothetical protein